MSHYFDILLLNSKLTFRPKFFLIFHPSPEKSSPFLGTFPKLSSLSLGDDQNIFHRQLTLDAFYLASLVDLA